MWRWTAEGRVENYGWHKNGGVCKVCLNVVELLSGIGKRLAFLFMHYTLRFFIPMTLVEIVRIYIKVDVLENEVMHVNIIDVLVIY